MGVHTQENLDEDWIKLMKEAKELGIEISEIKEFLKNEGM
ncbi:anti-repressor SinI family protein [Guptibacillus hwajinpoensis]|nr:anti-repressor SinI family protein [Pseudalkalibacillus hwajinpoensis]WLR61628.1 anti-repressor SinI family protein [Pseudalkalibacillus hwajinpoensis]